MKTPNVAPGQFAYGHLSSSQPFTPPSQAESVHPMHVQAMKRTARPYTTLNAPKSSSLKMPSIKSMGGPKGGY